MQEASARLFLCVLLRTAPRCVVARVTSLAGSRFFDVYVPSLGLQCRLLTTDVVPPVTPTWDAAGKSVPTPPAMLSYIMEEGMYAYKRLLLHAAEPCRPSQNAGKGQEELIGVNAGAVCVRTSCRPQHASIQLRHWCFLHCRVLRLEAMPGIAVLQAKVAALDGVANANRAVYEEGVEPLQLPVALQMLDRVPVVVSASQSGMDVPFARLMLA